MTRHLSEREEQVAELVAGGKTNREVSLALGIAESTVKVSLRNILRHTGLRNRVELAVWFERRRVAE